MQSDNFAAIQVVKKAHQSYQMAGRSFNRAELRVLLDEKAQIDYAIAYQGGALVQTTKADMSNGNSSSGRRGLLP